VASVRDPVADVCSVCPVHSLLLSWASQTAVEALSCASHVCIALLADTTRHVLCKCDKLEDSTVRQLVEEFTRHIGCDVFPMGTYVDGARTDALAWKLLHNLVLDWHADEARNVGARAATALTTLTEAVRTIVHSDLPGVGVTTRILLQNATDFELTLGQASGVSSGHWLEGLEPPARIQAGYRHMFGSAANGILGSTGGTVFYIIRTCKYGTVQLEMTWESPRFSSFNITYAVREMVTGAGGGPGTWHLSTSFVVEEVAGSRKVRGGVGDWDLCSVGCMIVQWHADNVHHMCCMLERCIADAACVATVMVAMCMRCVCMCACCVRMVLTPWWACSFGTTPPPCSGHPFARVPCETPELGPKFQSELLPRQSHPGSFLSPSWLFTTKMLFH
jgi:hypothetical protein